MLDEVQQCQLLETIYVIKLMQQNSRENIYLCIEEHIQKQISQRPKYATRNERKEKMLRNIKMGDGHACHMQLP